jgi:hypothetical protein
LPAEPDPLADLADFRDWLEALAALADFRQGLDALAEFLGEPESPGFPAGPCHEFPAGPCREFRAGLCREFPGGLHREFPDRLVFPDGLPHASRGGPGRRFPRAAVLVPRAR